MSADANDPALEPVERCCDAIANLPFEGKYLSAVSPKELWKRIDALWSSLSKTKLTMLDAGGVVYEAVGRFLEYIPSAAPDPPIDPEQELFEFVGAEWRELDPWIAIWQARTWHCSVFKDRKKLSKGFAGVSARLASLNALGPQFDIKKALAKACIDAGKDSAAIKILKEKSDDEPFLDALDFAITVLWDTTLILYRDAPLPGLRRWSESAALQILQGTLKNESLTLDAVAQRRSRLGLKIDQPKLISDRELAGNILAADGAALSAFARSSQKRR